MAWKLLLTLLFSLAMDTISSSPPCVNVTHSDCADDQGHNFLEVDIDTKEQCHVICGAFAEKCKFFIFDNQPFARGNCRLYDESFSMYIHHCNELAGPKISADGCDFMNPPDNSCQVYRNGKCDFGDGEETQYLSSWEHCQSSCNAISLCKFWQFEREEKLCRILYSKERNCTWEFSPREPLLDDCDNESPTTITSSTTTITSTTTTTATSITTATISTTIKPMCDIPDQQKYGDWFYPPSPSANTATCHLECHPGYVSDGRTIITCTDGVWSSKPTCVPAIGLIAGNSGSPQNTVEVYGEDIHRMLPNLPDERCDHSLQTTDSYVLLCGGYSTTSCLVLTTSQQWTFHSTITSLRRYHSSVSILGQLHLVGGIASPSTTEHLAPSTSSTWLPGINLREMTRVACAAKIHPEVYVVTGGYYNPGSVMSYNTTSGVATRYKDLIKPRFYHGCVYVRDSKTGLRGVLVAGGNDRFTRLGDSEMYDLSTGQWSTTGRLTTGRNAVSLMVLGTNILAFGGYDGSQYLSTVDRFNVTTMEWSPTEEMLEARGGHAVTGVPPGMVVHSR